MKTSPLSLSALSAALATALVGFVTGAAAQRVSVTHGATDTVRQGDAFALTFRYEDLPADDYALPELVGLVVVAGPSRQSQISIVNGHRSSTEAFSYRVVADQPGLAYVPSITVETADTTYATEAVTVFVTDNPDYVPPAAQDAAQQPARPTPPVPPRRRRPTVKM